MRLSPLIIHLRSKDTVFGQNIGGAAELELARMQTKPSTDMAFVIPIQETVSTNDYGNAVNQIITERFAVIAILKNDISQSDKLGWNAYDRVHNIRSQLFRALVGLEFKASVGKIVYAGGQLLPLNPAYMWYQFDFEYPVRLTEFDGYCDIEGEYELRDVLQESQLPDLTKIYTNYKMNPASDIPYTGDLPLADGYPDVALPDFMAQFIDISDDPNPGAFDRSFSSAFDFYRILNRRNDPK